MTKDRFEICHKPRLKRPSLIISWSEDAGRLGPAVADYLIEKCEAEKFCQIEPSCFFRLAGVSIKNDTIHFPRSEFYSSEKDDLVIFKSDAPGFEWFEFLNLALDVVENYCGVRELYIVGGIISLIAHTRMRRVLAVVNQARLKNKLSGYDIALDMDFQTPPGGRPTLSSFLLWTASRRNIGGVSLWGEVPFYISAAEDPKAVRTVLEFVNKRFSLDIDLSEIDTRLKKQEGIIQVMRTQNAEIDEYINRLESGEHLTQEESEKLLKEIDDVLKQKD